MRAKVPQTQGDLEAHLRDQLAFLEASAKAFDAGFDGEAKRLALSLRVLLHDGRTSHSLLGQLRRKNVDFVDTAWDFNPANLLTHCGLVLITIGPGAAYRAPLDNTPRPAKNAAFDQWWNKVVFVDKQRRQITRGQLVLMVADQDGGAHVDPTLDATYSDLSRRNSLGWMAVRNGQPGQMEGPERAAIRQIAHEVLKTLKSDHQASSKPLGAMTMAGLTVRSGVWPITPADQPVQKPYGKRRRNELCPCASGRKFKHCHGRV